MLLRKWVGATPSLIWLLLLFPVERTFAKKAKKKEEDSVKKVALLHHSFRVPLAFEEFLNDWSVSGSSLVERERLLVHPGVAERAGFVWNKAPLLTNDFEVTMQFRVVGPKGTVETLADQSFSLWYVYDNVTAGYNETNLIKANSWKEGLEEQGMTLSGSKAKFHGLGVVFSMAGFANPKSQVSAIWNDGAKELTYEHDVATGPYAKAADFRNTMNAAQFKLRVTPTSIEGHFKHSPSLSWNECFKIDRSSNPVKPGGYLGLSAWSGNKAYKKQSDLVSITQFEVFNYDTESIGEDMKDVSGDIQEAFREMLTDEKRHFVDQKTQSDHLNRLTRMLLEHADTSKPDDEKMLSSLTGIDNRVTKLDQDCKLVTKELQVLVGPAGTARTEAEKHESIKDGIVGLRRLLIKDGASHAAKHEVVQKMMTEVKQKHVEASKPEMFAEVSFNSEVLHSTVKSSSSQTTWMLLAIVFAILVIGGLMWNRMIYYERKHFL